MKLNYIILIIIFFSAIPFVYAEFNKQDSIKWLQKNTNWQQAPVQDATFSLLTLKANNIDVNAQASILLQREDQLNCYPRGNCNVKDTAFALLFLDEFNQDTNKTLTWLASTETKAQISGNWLIQILTNNNGTCSITHNNKIYNFTIDNKGKILPYNVNWLDVEDNLGISINKPVEAFLVDCKKLQDQSMIISLLRIIDNNIYITQQENSDKAVLEINSACYPSVKGRACDVETTFLASWAVNRATLKVNTGPYLEDNAQSNLHYAILYQITGNEKYAKLLSEKRNNGYWDNIYTTSFVIDSLKSNSNYGEIIDNTTGWLKSQQIETGTNRGSFNNGNLQDTAVAVYLGLNEGFTFYPPPPEERNKTRNETYEQKTFCGDNKKQDINDQGIYEECDGADDYACPGKCSKDNTCKCIISCQTDQECDNTKFCDQNIKECKSLDEKTCSTDQDCPVGKICVSALCTIFETTTTLEGTTPTTEPGERLTCNNDDACDENEDVDSCPSDCKEEKSSIFKKILIPLIIIIIIGLGIFFLRRFTKKPPEEEEAFFPKYPQEEQKPKPREMQRQQPQQPARRYQPSPKDEAVERELEKSLKEAQELFKKK